MCKSKEIHHTVCLHIDKHTKECMKRRIFSIFDHFLTCKPSFKVIYNYDICHNCRHAFTRFNIREKTAIELCESYRAQNRYLGPLTPRFCFSYGEPVFRPRGFEMLVDGGDEMGLGFPPFWVIVLNKAKSSARPPNSASPAQLSHIHSEPG